MGTVYLVTNTANGKTYIGVTRFSVDHRWKQHCWSASAGKRSRLYSAIRKYGARNFTIIAVASCLKELGPVERDVIESFAPEYNQTNGGEVTKGRKLSAETIARIAASNTGKRRSPEQCAANSERKKRQYEARPELLAQTVERLALARETVDQEKRKNAAAKACRERVWTDAQRAKLSASCMGRRYDASVIEKVAAKKRKKVECTTLGRQFGSILEASAALGISNSGIGKVCAGKRGSVGGHHFRYIGA